MKILLKIMFLTCLVSDICPAAETAAGEGDVSPPSSTPKSALKGARGAPGGSVTWSNSTLERYDARERMLVACQAAIDAERARTSGGESVEGTAPPLATQAGTDEPWEEADVDDTSSPIIGEDGDASVAATSGSGGALRRGKGITSRPSDPKTSAELGFLMISTDVIDAPLGDGRPAPGGGGILSAADGSS